MDLQDLGRRAKSAPSYREIPGMSTLPDEYGRTFRLWSPQSPRKWVQESGPILRCSPNVATLLPDFSDHATLWALVGLVIADGYTMTPATATQPWALSFGARVYHGASLAETAVSALEVA